MRPAEAILEPAIDAVQHFKLVPVTPIRARTDATADSVDKLAVVCRNGDEGAGDRLVIQDATSEHEEVLVDLVLPLKRHGFRLLIRTFHEPNRWPQRKKP